MIFMCLDWKKFKSAKEALLEKEGWECTEPMIDKERGIKDGRIIEEVGVFMVKGMI